jgi:S-DNA-T family DNA segregation ATPase FtsK/SpoIIIE
MESNLTNFSLPLTLGLDSTTNEPVSIDLGKCGNILLAGSTKQGKSHCIHNMISRMNALPTPPEMILFDPKRCESRRYKDRFRVIEDFDEAKRVLFEELFENEIIRKRYLSTCKDRSPLVIIIDELLDLIFMHKSKSSKYVSDRNRYEAIIKILDIGPELNIFTIISTQSSDKDILTKKILDNCQTRLAFRTINAQDSRRILKKPGAEDLLGRVEAILYQEGKCRKIQCP